MSTAVQQRTILVVDDSSVARELIYWSLGGPSSVFAILTANDGVEALDTLENTPVDLIVTDLQMPSMDGLTMLSNIRADTRLRDIPIVVVTGHDDPEVEVETREAGATAFLVKPFSPSQLLGMVDDLIMNEAPDSPPAKTHLSIQMLIDALPYLAMVLDEDHHVLIGNRAYYDATGVGITDCPITCSTSVHGEEGEPAGCPLTRSVATGEPSESLVDDLRFGRLLVSVYPLDEGAADGRRLFLHLARPVPEMDGPNE